AENIVLLGIVWLLLIAGAWALGELSSERAILDLRGLGIMLVGPLVWLVTVLLIAGPAGARLLIDLSGAARLPHGHLFVIALALTVAAGGYPALAWLRKRALISTPAGLGAVALAIMPAALFVGARTFSIGATLTSGWPELNIGKPSITTGIVLAVLGALSVAVAGLLALGRRDPRSLVAALTLAQAGWGLVGLGVGAPLSELGVTLLLATSVLGLGAVIAALVAGGAITADVEPDSAGPRVFGEPLRPALMFAWLAGCATLVGVPLLAGFAPLQLISAESLTGSRLNIPLVGLAWVGSALLAIALTRATAPAFSAPIGADYALADEEDAESDTTDDEDADVTDEESGAETTGAGSATGPELRLEELPGIALGVLLVIAGVAPAIAVTLARDAAGATLQAGALDAVLDPNSSGYSAGVGQWFATPVVILVVVIALVMAYLRTRLPRSVHPLYLAGAQPEAEVAGAVVEGSVEPAEAGTSTELATVDAEGAPPPAELEALPEPGEAWSDLRPALRSNWVTPGVVWLGLNDETEEADATGEVAEDDVADEDESDADTTTANDAASLRAVASDSSEPAAEAAGEEP
ncbi:MAG: hypothetical protein KGO05_16375, partial [Chloroflexota bacterium]|nr:hypothetical protein [Chloroflexota bacterium]